MISVLQLKNSHAPQVKNSRLKSIIIFNPIWHDASTPSEKSIKAFINQKLLWSSPAISRRKSTRIHWSFIVLISASPFFPSTHALLTLCSLLVIFTLSAVWKHFTSCGDRLSRDYRVDSWDSSFAIKCYFIQHRSAVALCSNSSFLVCERLSVLLKCSFVIATPSRSCRRLRRSRNMHNSWIRKWMTEVVPGSAPQTKHFTHRFIFLPSQCMCTSEILKAFGLATKFINLQDMNCASMDRNIISRCLLAASQVRK